MSTHPLNPARCHASTVRDVLASALSFGGLVAMPVTRRTAPRFALGVQH